MYYLSNRSSLGLGAEASRTMHVTRYEDILWHKSTEDKGGTFFGSTVPASWSGNKGAVTSYLWLLPGQQLPRGYFTADVELFVLSGSLHIDDWLCEKHGYSYIPAFMTIKGIRVVDSSCVLWMYNGCEPAEFVSGESPLSPDMTKFIPALDAQLIPWGGTDTTQFETAKKKYLRRDDSGGGTWLLALLPHYNAAGGMIQCYNEEAIILAGNLSIGGICLQRFDHVYVPEFTTVGKHKSEDGCLCIVRVDRDLSQPGVVSSYRFSC